MSKRTSGGANGRGNDRLVVHRPEGWAVTAPRAQRASSVHRRQADAERQAKATVAGLGGGEVRIQDRHGRWRDSDTVKPGNDPRSSKDRRH